MFVANDPAGRQMIARYERDPNSVPRIRHTLSETSKDIILLEEVLLYLQAGFNLGSTWGHLGQPRVNLTVRS